MIVRRVLQRDERLARVRHSIDPRLLSADSMGGKRNVLRTVGQ